MVLPVGGDSSERPHHGERQKSLQMDDKTSAQFVQWLRELPKVCNNLACQFIHVTIFVTLVELACFAGWADLASIRQKDRWILCARQRCILRCTHVLQEHDYGVTAQGESWG